jgi:hypothetical protein
VRSLERILTFGIFSSCRGITGYCTATIAHAYSNNIYAYEVIIAIYVFYSTRTYDKILEILRISDFMSFVNEIFGILEAILGILRDADKVRVDVSL